MERSGKISKQRAIPWPRVLAEGLVIVASILLAFAIDSWAEAARERTSERELLLQIRSELELTRNRLEAAIQIHERRVEESSEVLRVGFGIDQPPESFPRLLTSVLVGGTSTYLETGTLDGALVSERLNLIHDLELRRLLALWPGAYEEFREEEVAIRDLSIMQGDSYSDLPLASRMLSVVGLPDATAGNDDQEVASMLRYVGSSGGQNFIGTRMLRESVAARDGRQLLELLDNIMERLPDDGTPPD